MSYTVRLTTDKLELHAFLQRDPVWGAYAIGDLEPEHFSWCNWYVADAASGPAALVLVYKRLDPPILLTVGAPEGLTDIFRQASLPRRVYISAQDQHMPSLRAYYDFSGDRLRPMMRMVVRPGRFQPVSTPVELVLRRLGPADVPAIQTLYALGGAFAPDVFNLSQVAEGVFFGLETPVRSGKGNGLLVAVAGTHLVAPNWGVAAVGNVYTHPAHRALGYGGLLTSTLTAELLTRGLLVVLNVDQRNHAAVHVYRKLGYETACRFWEGIGMCDQPPSHRSIDCATRGDNQ